MRRTHRYGFLWLAALLWFVGAPLAGCELECETNADNSARDVVDEIGDEVEDVAKELKKKN